MMTAPLRSDATTVNVALGSRAYDIVIGRGVAASLGARIAALKRGARLAIVTDENVARVHLETIESQLSAAGMTASRIVVPPGEASKSFASFERVCDALIAARIERNDLIVAFGQAAQEDDMDRLLEILHPDVVFTSDGGGVVTAARKPLEGADRVARAMIALAARGGTFELVDVNGEPGVLGHGPDGIPTVMAFTVDDGRIVALDIQRNPEKLRRLP